MSIRDYFVYDKGLELVEAREIKKHLNEFFKSLVKNFPESLKRCSFFVFNGISILEEISLKTPFIKNPGIKTSNRSVFDLHYWLAFKTIKNKDFIIDPIFKYIGLREFSKDKLDETHSFYYFDEESIKKQEVKLNIIGV